MKKVLLVKDVHYDEPRVVGIYGGIRSASRKLKVKFLKAGLPSVWFSKDNRLVGIKYNVV